MKKNTAVQVLLVDDEAELCELMAFQLEHDGFGVHTAHSGREAIKLLKNKPVDLIISDVSMPNGNGLDLLEHINTFPPKERPLFLFISGFSGMSEKEALEKGAFSCLQKPISFKGIKFELLRAISSKK